MKKLFLLGVFFCLTQANGTTVKNDDGLTRCEVIVALRGLMVKAQDECGFNKYNDKLNTDASVCLRGELSGDRGIGILMLGTMKFDEYIQERGKQVTCEALLKKFPEYVAE